MDVEISIEDVIAEVHEELFCDDCGDTREAGHPVCDKCRYCADCLVEISGTKHPDYVEGVVCDKCNEARQETPEDEDTICGTCNGSGEGMYDGSSCRSCGGSGAPKPSRDWDDYEPPSRDDW